MEKRRTYIASDHAGFELKAGLIPYLRALGHEVTDLGAHALDPKDDYPQFVTPCAEKVAEADRERAGAARAFPPAFGVIIGGSGHGEAMAANRVKGARAAVFYGGRKAASVLDVTGTPSADDYDIVRVSRQHNDANILSFGARFITTNEAEEAIRVFIETPFSTDTRQERRLAEF